MKFFRQLAAGVNTAPLLQAIQSQPDLWDAKRFRTTFPGSPHAGASDIWLRFNCEERPADNTDGRALGAGEIVWHPAAPHLPQAPPRVRDLMHAIGAYQLDRLLITRLKPGARITPHADNVGAYVNDPCRARYHVVLRGEPGNMFRCGDETVEMRTGEVWWFDALAEHECLNASAADRIHLLVDLVTWPAATTPAATSAIGTA